jgi:ankyrin repeat protein
MKKSIILIALFLLASQMNEFVFPSDANSSTPLIITAAEQGDKPAIQTLITGGADVNQKAEDGRTALMVVANTGRDDIVQLLLDNGARVNDTASNGFIALMAATLSKAESSLAIMARLIAQGADVNLQDADGATVLMGAVLMNDVNKVTLLINSGANVSLTDNHGITAKAYTVFKNNPDIFKLFP